MDCNPDGKNMSTEFEHYLEKIKEIGYVQKGVVGIVEISGLPGIRAGEMVCFETGQVGQVLAYSNDKIEVQVLSKRSVKIGTRVVRTDHRLAVPVSDQILGKMIGALGQEVRGQVAEKDVVYRPIDVTPVGISGRQKITRSLLTGIILTDLMVPLGKGQRELILGDRKTGKSLLVLQAMVNQAKEGSVCIYAAIGKKKTEIMKAESFFKAQGIMDKTVIVASSSQDSAAEIYICPYTAMAIAEYFRDQGRDVLVVLDDMTTHAKFYREISLLSRKFPGRDSYPGDIFYTHSKLLERAGNFLVDGKDVSITCLPIAETVQGDISGYIQTNLMSMTDGHIYFDNELFSRGQRPAINPFVSVTRVGRQTQTALRRDAGRMLFELLNAYVRAQSFLKFGAELGENSRQVLTTGDMIMKFFNQPLNLVIPINVQLAMLGLLISGIWNGEEIGKVVGAYEKNAVFKKLIDQLVDGSLTMDKLMQEARKSADAVLAILA